MASERDDSLTIKVSIIPEEGMERDWTIPPEAFAEGKHPLPVSGPVALHGKLYKTGEIVYLDGEISGALELTCSRCLKKFESRFDGEVSSVYMPSHGMDIEEREVELTAEDMDAQLYQGEAISLFEPVRDQIALSIPISPLCDEKCKGLCPVCGANLNETECGCELKTEDPRFAALKNIKFK